MRRLIDLAVERLTDSTEFVLSSEELASLHARGMADESMAGSPRRWARSMGSDGHKLRLSGRRAEAVLGALVDMGISSERLSARGYGEAFPVAGNASAAGRQMNRIGAWRFCSPTKQAACPAGTRFA